MAELYGKMYVCMEYIPVNDLHIFPYNFVEI